MFNKAKELFEKKGINMDFLDEPKIAAEVAHIEHCWSFMPEVVKENKIFPLYVSGNLYYRLFIALPEEVKAINESPEKHSFYLTLSDFLERNARAYGVDKETSFRYMLYLATAEYLVMD